MKNSDKENHKQFETIEEWVMKESIPFSVSSNISLQSALDKLFSSLDNTIKLLGLGEPLHGGKDFLKLRNEIFMYLVKIFNYSAIAIESSFPKSWIINEFVNGRGPESFEQIQEVGFSHGFGNIEANRELVEWMRLYNANPENKKKIHFYGFDSPTEVTNTDSPRQLLYFVIDYLSSIDENISQEYKNDIDQLIGEDAAWENPEAIMDATKSIGLSEKAIKLRIKTEELIFELKTRRPTCEAKTNKELFLEALHFAFETQQLLNYHAVLAKQSDQRLTRLTRIRNALMADNLNYIATREKDRGKILVFAHNSHLQKSESQLNPVGSHLECIFGKEYYAIGGGLGESEINGISKPEPNTLEGKIVYNTGTAKFLPTYRGQGLPFKEIDVLQKRNRSSKNPTYFPLTPTSLHHFDCLITLENTEYEPGGGWFLQK